MEIFESPLAMVRSLPEACHARLVIRHSARFPILNQDEVFTMGLTPLGIAQSEKLGAALAPLRKPGRLLTSPVGRCLDTARGIAHGAGWSTEVCPEYRLSHPFIEPVWNALPIYWKKDPMPDQLVELMYLLLEGADQPETLDLFATHDTIVAALAGFFTGIHFFYPDYWPDYLEGVLIWRNKDQVHLRWRTDEIVIGPWPTPGIHQLDLGFLK